MTRRLGRLTYRELPSEQLVVWFSTKRHVVSPCLEDTFRCSQNDLSFCISPTVVAKGRQKLTTALESHVLFRDESKSDR